MFFWRTKRRLAQQEAEHRARLESTYAVYLLNRAGIDNLLVDNARLEGRLAYVREKDEQLWFDSMRKSVAAPKRDWPPLDHDLPYEPEPLPDEQPEPLG